MGGILRLVIIGLIIWFAWRFLQRYLTVRQDDPSTAAPPPPSSQAMRRCAHCNVHIPEGESTQSRGQFFCSEAHRDAFFRERR